MEPKSICHCRGSPGPTSWCSALICSRICLRTSRSEEHTSELQSLRHLVCRLLLEKKKKRFLRLRAESTRLERSDSSCPTVTAGVRARHHEGCHVHAAEPAARPLRRMCVRRDLESR